MTKYTYVALFNEDEDLGVYTITVPDLPGVISEGVTIEESIKQITDALEIWLLSAEDMSLNINPPSIFSDLQKKIKGKNDFLQYITVDTDFARKREMNKSVKKTLTIPSWLNDLAIEKDINFSQLLQQALKQELDV